MPTSTPPSSLPPITPPGVRRLLGRRWPHRHHRSRRDPRGSRERPSRRISPRCGPPRVRSWPRPSPSCRRGAGPADHAPRRRDAGRADRRARRRRRGPTDPQAGAGPGRRRPRRDGPGRRRRRRGRASPTRPRRSWSRWSTRRRREVRELLAYPPESAAGIMTPDFVAVAPVPDGRRGARAAPPGRRRGRDGLLRLRHRSGDRAAARRAVAAQPGAGAALEAGLAADGHRRRQRPGRRRPGDRRAAAEQAQLAGAAGRRRAGSAARDHHGRRRRRRPAGGGRRGHRAAGRLAAAGRAVPAGQPAAPVPQADRLAAGAVRGRGVHRHRPAATSRRPSPRWSRWRSSSRS